jgi:hypothetical protein
MSRKVKKLAQSIPANLLQENVKVRRNPVYKSPLNLPFNKRGLKIPPLKRGLGGILKSKTFHIRIIMLNAILAFPCYLIRLLDLEGSLK